jgi:KaiC/GvpD/RAD55 family RecA-like ATPase/chromosome segregation ATPase
LLLSRESEANKLLLEAQAKDREIKNRLSEIEAEESTQETMRKELDSLQNALAEREKQIGVKESALDMKSLEIVAAREQLGTVAAEKTNIKSMEQQLLMRQEALSEKEINLRAMEDDLRKKAERAERLTARADQQINELVEKENSLLKREQTIAEKEAGLRAEIEKLNSGLEEMQSARATITDHERQYIDLTETTRSKLTAVSVKEEEAARKMAALEKREEKIKELELRLRSEHDSINSKLRELLEKEKTLKAEETEIGLRNAELRAREQEILESVEDIEEVRAEVPGEDDGQERTLDYREKRLADKEREAKSRLYQREKELEKREESLRVHLRKDIEGMEGAVEEEYSEEKVKTGMERLDDLLMGGMPFGSNVLFVGPPFIGKEVAMLLFIAEGLRKGVPAVIVTTSHPPSEISKEMAPILPAFMEFEQVGLVYWIDATGMQSGIRDESATGNRVTTVSGPGNFKAITDAVDACVKSIAKQKQPYFRFAYMSLSMSITQSDEKNSFQFIQSLAGRLKMGGAVSVFAVERGMHTEQQLESIQHHMTGSVQFKTDKQKTLLSVQGVADAQTRDWIEYKHSNKALMIGAFSLERIR